MARVVVPTSPANRRTDSDSSPRRWIVRSAAVRSAVAVCSSCSRGRPMLDSISQRCYGTSLRNPLAGGSHVSGAMPETGKASLAYETHGEGVPVVFLHGLTFDRRTWRPIIERLGGGVRSIALDLPGHGETGGPGCRLEEAAARINATLRGIDVDAPIIVGHSM